VGHDDPLGDITVSLETLLSSDMLEHTFDDVPLSTQGTATFSVQWKPKNNSHPVVMEWIRSDKQMSAVMHKTIIAAVTKEQPVDHRKALDISELYVEGEKLEEEPPNGTQVHVPAVYRELLPMTREVGGPKNLFDEIAARFAERGVTVYDRPACGVPTVVVLSPELYQRQDLTKQLLNCFPLNQREDLAKQVRRAPRPGAGANWLASGTGANTRQSARLSAQRDSAASVGNDMLSVSLYSTAQSLQWYTSRCPDLFKPIVLTQSFQQWPASKVLQKIVVGRIAIELGKLPAPPVDEDGDLFYYEFEVEPPPDPAPVEEPTPPPKSAASSVLEFLTAPFRKPMQLEGDAVEEVKYNERGSIILEDGAFFSQAVVSSKLHEPEKTGNVLGFLSAPFRKKPVEETNLFAQTAISSKAKPTPKPKPESHAQQVLAVVEDSNFTKRGSLVLEEGAFFAQTAVKSPVLKHNLKHVEVGQGGLTREESHLPSEYFDEEPAAEAAPELKKTAAFNSRGSIELEGDALAAKAAERVGASHEKSRLELPELKHVEAGQGGLTREQSHLPPGMFDEEPAAEPALPLKHVEVGQGGLTPELIHLQLGAFEEPKSAAELTKATKSKMKKVASFNARGSIVFN
jgi:hypothetical protein